MSRRRGDHLFPQDAEEEAAAGNGNGAASTALFGKDNPLDVIFGDDAEEAEAEKDMGEAPEARVRRRRWTKLDDGVRARVGRKSFVMASCWACCTFPAYLAIGALVMSNLVYCFFALSPNDIPWLAGPPPTGAHYRSCERNGLMYWLIWTTSTLRILFIAVVPWIIGLIIVKGFTGQIMPVNLFLILYGLYDLAVTSFFLLITYTGTKCADTPLCRGYTDPNTPTTWWLLTTWAGVAYFFVWLIFHFILAGTKRRLQRAQDHAAGQAEAS
jgi:hypothetical protein